jgi:hypothetical protein
MATGIKRETAKRHKWNDDNVCARCGLRRMIFGFKEVGYMFPGATPNEPWLWTAGACRDKGAK